MPEERTRTIPEEVTYIVDLPPAAVMARLRAEEGVAVVPALPARTRRGARFLAAVGERSFEVVQNVGPSTIDAEGAEVRRFALAAEVTATAEGTRVRARFRPGPPLRQFPYWIAWAVCGLWLGATGVAPGKMMLVAIFVALTLPVFLHERRRARGTAEDRLELLNLMERLLGPAAIGGSSAEQTPYRDGHALPVAAAEDEDEDDDER